MEIKISSEKSVFILSSATMAIAFYIPEEYGPEPTTATTRIPMGPSTLSKSTSSARCSLKTGTSNNTTNRSQQQNNNNYCSMRIPFLHELIQELYNLFTSFYGESGSNNVNITQQESRRSSPGSPWPWPISSESVDDTSNADSNNNIDGMVNLNYIPRVRNTRRRRHPAGTSGVSQVEEITPSVPLVPLPLIQNPAPAVNCSTRETAAGQIESLSPILELKLETTNIIVGCTLRKFADSFEVSIV